jgi:hypothetical protein
VVVSPRVDSTPRLHEFGDGYTSFSYRYVDPDDDTRLSSEATVTITITPVNDPPTALPDHLTVKPGTEPVIVLRAVDVDENASTPRAYAPSFAPHGFARVSRFPRAGLLLQLGANGSHGDIIDARVTQQASVSSWVSEVVRYSSQFSRCRNCFVWSGAHPTTGCNQANPAATSTCTGADCTVPYGQPLVWGDATCTEIAWQANQIVGPPDFYPHHGDTTLGWDLSAENSGLEWIELRFGTPVYVSGFELYETNKPGAVYRVSTTQQYTDDNTIACCGRDAAAAQPACASLPICSEETAWTPVWRGTAANNGDQASLFSPPFCPSPYKTNVLRVDLDTAAATGWNNYDAAKLTGTLTFPRGLVQPNAHAPAGDENRVTYKPLKGVHGIDSFEFE